MSWFRRKPREFDYAAIRVGNVYVLPPTEEDVREFRKKRRRELTRRGFLVGGVVLALGALSIPFWPRGGDEGRGRVAELKKLLLAFQPAQADPQEKKRVRAACLALYSDPDPEIRRLCALYMGAFPDDDVVCAALWTIIDNDPVERNRRTALDSLLESSRDQDVPRLKELHETAPWAREVIDGALELYPFQSLRKALNRR